MDTLALHFTLSDLAHYYREHKLYVLAAYYEELATELFNTDTETHHV